MIPLATVESLHQVLKTLYGKMILLCGDLTGFCTAIAALGALLFISYRVWQALARAEPIEVFPLLRPFAIGICILLFPKLVLGTLNGVFDGLAQGTHQLLAGQQFSMQEYQRQMVSLEEENRKRDLPVVTAPNEEYDRQLDEIIGSQDQATMDRMYEEQSDYRYHTIFETICSNLLEMLFEAASLIINTIRTFYLVVLSVLGPLAFALSVYDGFQQTMLQWLSKYISVSLWLPISDLFGAMLAKLQALSLQQDMALMQSDPFYFFDSSNIVYLIFLIIGICGYFCIPSIAGWIVQTGGATGSYNRGIATVGRFAAGMAGQAVGAVYGNSRAMNKIYKK